MATKFEIEQRIIDNARQRKLGQCDHKLEYLVPVKISEEFLDSDAFSSLKNSWAKKSLNFVFGMMFVAAIIKVMSDPDETWTAAMLLGSICGGLWFFWKFLDNRVIIKIEPKGLTIHPSIFNEWKDIEYLYFCTRYDSESTESRVYLVVNSRACIDCEVRVDELQWPLEKLGRTLYQCMRKFGN